MRAFYPDVSKIIERILKENTNVLNQQAKKEMEKQEAINAAEVQVKQVNKTQ